MKHVPDVAHAGTGWFRAFHVNLNGRVVDCPQKLHYNALAGQIPDAVGPEVWVEVHPRLVPGDTGTVVVEVQAELGVARTGIFDKTTEEALRGYRRVRGLSDEPVVDAEVYRCFLSVVPGHLKLDLRRP